MNVVDFHAFISPQSSMIGCAPPRLSSDGTWPRSTGDAAVFLASLSSVPSGLKDVIVSDTYARAPRDTFL